MGALLVVLVELRFELSEMLLDVLYDLCVLKVHNRQLALDAEVRDELDHARFLTAHLARSPRHILEVRVVEGFTLFELVDLEHTDIVLQLCNRSRLPSKLRLPRLLQIIFPDWLVEVLELGAREVCEGLLRLFEVFVIRTINLIEDLVIVAIAEFDTTTEGAGRRHPIKGCLYKLTINEAIRGSTLPDVLNLVLYDSDGYFSHDGVGPLE